MNRDIWGVFHDGVIKRVENCETGTLRIEIEIAYLRALFSEPGYSFFVKLAGCSHFQFSEYNEAPTDNLQHIQAREPEILYVASEQPLVLDCTMGTLDLEYESMKISLPSGTDVSYDALVSACDKYWSEWRRQNYT